MVAIEQLECSGELREALQAHADCMLEIYRELHKLTCAGVTAEESYSELFESAANYSAWFKSRKRVANSMKAAAEANASTADSVAEG